MRITPLGRGKPAALAAVLAATCLAIAACGDDNGDSGGSSGGGGGGSKKMTLLAGVKGDGTVWVRGDAKPSIVTCTWISYDFGTSLSPIPYKWRVRLAPHQYATNSRSDAYPRHVRCVYHRW